MPSYDCMTPEELALWRDNQGSYVRAASPCTDCPASFMREALSRGLCRRDRHRWSADLSPILDGDRRVYKREWMRTYRASQRATVGAQS